MAAVSAFGRLAATLATSSKRRQTPKRTIIRDTGPFLVLPTRLAVNATSVGIDP
jgi:hypothetical protein